jgi:hypothetical protein
MRGDRPAPPSRPDLDPFHAQLAEWREEFEELKIMGQKLTAEALATWHAELAALDEQIDAATERLEALKRATRGHSDQAR